MAKKAKILAGVIVAMSVGAVFGGEKPDGNILSIQPVTAENRFGLEESARLIKELEMALRAKGYEEREIEHIIRQIAGQIRQERLRARNQRNQGR